MTATELLREVLPVVALLSLGFLVVLAAVLLGGWLWRRIIRSLADHDIHGEGVKGGQRSALGCSQDARP